MGAELNSEEPRLVPAIRRTGRRQWLQENLENDLRALSDDLFRAFCHEWSQPYEVSDSRDEAISKLISTASAAGRFLDLSRAANEYRAFGNCQSAPDPAITAASNLSDELAGLRDQLAVLQKERLTEEQLGERIKEIVQTVERAAVSSEDLTAKLLLPPPELRNVRLVPAHLLERVEEYHADENVLWAVAGFLAGALIAFPVNWLTNETITINPFAIVLMCVLLAFLVAVGVWIARLRARAKAAKAKMLGGAG